MEHIKGNSAIALESAIKIMKEAEGHAVKLEGGAEIVESIKRILTAGIPVMGHLGLTPNQYTNLAHIVLERRKTKKPKN